MVKILVTGIAGFIGYYTARKLVRLDTYEIVGIDNLNNYYEVSLKEDRLKDLGLKPADSISTKHKNLKFKKIDISDDLAMMELFKVEKFDYVIHLAAQAGVRYSIENPRSYIKSNAEGFLNILEGCRHNEIKHLIYASSSSVYGENAKVPFSTKDPVDHPVSLYAATKRSNELMAHTYSHLYNLPTTGLRFFTVYGPWGRPDMAPFLFADAIYNGQEINVFNNGDMERDFTYVEDIVEAQIKLLDIIPNLNSGCTYPNVSNGPFKLYNIGNSNPVNLLEFINILENHIGIKAIKRMLPMQKGDVSKTFADVEDLYKIIHFRPKTILDEGIKKFVDWYKVYYQK